METSGPQAGWYANPEGTGLRYWDGTAWTDLYRESAEQPSIPAPTPRTVWTVCALLILSVGVAYGIPFFGFLLSLLIPLIAISGRDVLWPAVARRIAVRAAILAWIGLWLPAVLDFFTGIFYALGAEVSTSWLILPLCGPEELMAWVLPAAAATLLVGVGVAFSVLRCTPWFWVVAMWLAPWAHMAVFSVLPHEIIC